MGNPKNSREFAEALVGIGTIDTPEMQALKEEVDRILAKKLTDEEQAVLDEKQAKVESLCKELESLVANVLLTALNELELNPVSAARKVDDFVHTIGRNILVKIEPEAIERTKHLHELTLAVLAANAAEAAKSEAGNGETVPPDPNAPMDKNLN